MKDKGLSIPESARLIAEKYKMGRMVPEGDGWSWEFEVDPQAIQALTEAMQSERLACIKQLEAEAATYPNAHGIVYMTAARLLSEVIK